MASPRYGPKHQALRKQWAPIVATGKVKCWRCGHLIPADAPWDLGHGDGAERDQHKGPEHRGQCNRATRTHLAQQRQRPTTTHPGMIGD